MSIKLLLSVFILIFASVHAEIFEIEHLDDIRPYITRQGGLVLLDIDDTLITNPTSLGCPAWRNWVQSKIPAYNSDYVIYDALALFIAKNIPYKPVEPSTAQLVSDLQMSDIPVFALTARGRTQWHSTDIAGVDQFTHEQLNRVGIDFSRTVIPAGLERLEAAYFYNGILFAQHIKKGDLLKHLLKDLDYRPASIIFVDDNPGQLVSVEAAVKELDIPFVGFWYRRTEFTYPNFNPLIAVAQLESLLLKREILSDDEAHELLPNLQELDPAEYLKSVLDQVDFDLLRPIL